MASKGLFFAQGLLEGASEKKTKEEERQQKIQDEIRKMQLKALGTNIETYQKRRAAAKQVKAYQDSGNYTLAFYTMTKADGDVTDWEQIHKKYEGFDEPTERNKEAINAWLKDVDSAPEPTWEDDVGKIHAASANRNRAAESLYERFFGVSPEDTVISASHGDHVSKPPAQEDTPEPGTTTPKGFEFRPKTEEFKPKHYSDTVTLKGGQTAPRVTSFYFNKQGEPVILGETVGTPKGAAAVAPELKAQQVTAINGMVDTTIKELRDAGKEDLANMLDHGIGGKSGKTGRFGGVQARWKQLADELRKDPSIDPTIAYQIATDEIIKMYNAGLIREQSNYMGLGKSDYTILKDPNEISDALVKAYKEGRITLDELRELRYKHLAGY